MHWRVEKHEIHMFQSFYLYPFISKILLNLLVQLDLLKEKIELGVVTQRPTDPERRLVSKTGSYPSGPGLTRSDPVKPFREHKFHIRNRNDSPLDLLERRLQDGHFLLSQASRNLDSKGIKIAVQFTARTSVRKLPPANEIAPLHAPLLLKTVSSLHLQMRPLRKSKKHESKLVLEEIIGLTAKSANGLASIASKGDCVYLAGCVVVAYNVESGDQSHLVASSRTPKPLSCVAALDSNGGVIAAGELGHQPAVLVWDYASRVLLSELKVHQYGVACIAFSPDGKHLVSVGYPHDGYLCLWDWRSGKLVSKFKSTSSCSVISCVSFSSDARTFVTAGKRHLKIWTIGSSTRSSSNTGGGGLIMDGKSANLGSQRGSSFVSVVSTTTSTAVGGRERAKFSSIYALTDTGMSSIIVEKSFALSVSKEFIACACNYGIVQLFTVGTLNHAGSLQYSASKEQHESKYMVSNGADKPLQHDPTLPDAIACQFSTSEKLVSTGIFERDIVESGVCSHGFRSMAVSLDGKYLASGDCQGSLHIYNLKTMDYTCLQDSHEAEILSLSFSSPTEIMDGTVREVAEDKYLLASSGRDRMIHLYDVERSLVFRDVDITNTGCTILRRHHQIASNGTVYDMAIDPEMKIVVTVGQDKKINTFDISSGKLARSFKQDGDFGEPIKVSMDPTSSFLVCSYSNKSICMYDFSNGELVAQAVGHSEVITGIIFLPDCQHIISVGGEGCIFVWKIPSLLSSRMLEKLKEFGDPLLSTSVPEEMLSNECNLHAEFDHSLHTKPQNALRPGLPEPNSMGLSEFRFSISRLPNWAQTKVATKENLPMHPESISAQGQTKGVGSTETTLKHLAVMSIPGPSYLVEDVKQDPMLKEWDQSCYTGNSCENGELQSVYGAAPCSEAPIKQFDSETTEALEQTTKSWDESTSTQDDNLFSQHFSNLSADIKLKGRKSSARRSYSARFFVRRDHLADCRRIFETSNHTPAGDSLNFCEEAPHISPEDPSMTPQEEEQVSDSDRKEAEEFKLKDQTSASKVAAVQKTVDECKEALLSLDAAAERSLQLFSNLSSLISREEGAEIYEKAAGVLPSVMEKLNALACVLQFNRSSASRTNVENCNFEPILEKFAESLSNKVLELVKKSM
ncbi:hypothetical protein Sjap_014010 [Stephania japonica]|uniref:Mitogen-activated protein kinase-binding protein 1 n=1 Tax=Stephania japonica TaxID=461633 RepID=A0AAP0IZ40_9MAGN